MVRWKEERKKEGLGLSNRLILFFFLIYRTAMKECMHACLRGGIGGPCCTKTRQHNTRLISKYWYAPRFLPLLPFSSPLLLFLLLSSSPLLLFSSSSLQLWLKLINSNSTMVGHLRTDVIHGETARVLTKVPTPLLPFPARIILYFGCSFYSNIQIQR